jgi:phage-related protein
MENLNPGGWVEFVDIPTKIFSDDGSLQNAPSINEWDRLHNEASQRFGKRMDVVQHYRQWMIDAGFKNVREDVYKVCPLYIR